MTTETQAPSNSDNSPGMFHTVYRKINAALVSLQLIAIALVGYLMFYSRVVLTPNNYNQWGSALLIVGILYFFSPVVSGIGLLLSAFKTKDATDGDLAKKMLAFWGIVLIGIAIFAVS